MIDIDEFALLCDSYLMPVNNEQGSYRCLVLV